MTGQSYLRPLRTAVLAVMYCLAAVTSATAHAGPTAVPLPAGTVRGTARAHRFTYYRFTYPGNSAGMSVTLEVPAATTAFDQAVGFNVFLADGRRLAPQVPTPQERILRFSRPESGTAFLQLYDYAATDFSYVLTQTGILPPPVPLPPVSSSQAPLRLGALNPYTALELPAATTCSLLPGQTLYYRFRTARAGIYVFHLSTQPGRRSAAPNFGVRLLDDAGKVLARSAVRGVQYGEQRMSAALGAGRRYLELYNVSRNDTLNCRLTVAGAAIVARA